MDAMPTASVDVHPYASPASKMRESADISKIAPALVKAQAVIENPARNRDVKVTNKDGKSYTFRYATLDAINEAIRHVLAENGLCVMQPIVATERGVSLVTRLLHESGQWMECDIPLAPPGPDPKAFGSAVTYLRRYAVSAMLNVSPDEDDDASAAAGSHMEDRAPRRDTSPGHARGARQADARPQALTDDREGAGDPVQALTAHARAARSIEDGQALLEAWQQHAAALEQHRGSAAWQAMERELGKGLQWSLGPVLAMAFTTALRADDAQHIAALRRKWDGEWAKTLRAVEQQAPAIHAALARHVAAQAARVRNAQRQPPQEPHGPSGGKTGGDDAPEPGTDTPADRSDAIRAAHGQDGAPPPD